MLLLLKSAAGGGGAVSYTLTCAAGSYAIAGQAATLKRSRTLALATGTYALTGVAATLKVSRQLSLAAGAYTYAGVAASLRVDRNLSLAAGSYAIAGQAATFKLSRNLSLNAGSYALTGQAATLDYTPGVTGVAYELVCDSGAYVISGQSAELTYSSQSIGRRWKKKRHYAEIDGKLLVFDTQADAVNAVLQNRQAPTESTKATEVIDLPVVREYAQVTGKIEQYNEAYNSEHYEALMALFEQMQDEDDIETLLML